MKEKLWYVPLELHKFQQCAVEGCDIDAAAEFMIQRPDGVTFYMGACDASAHQDRVITGLESIGGKSSPHSISKKKLRVDQLYIQPKGENEKCKFLEWELIQRAEPEKKVPVAPIFINPDGTVKTCGDDWKWIDQHMWWMDVEGKSIHISKLSTPELIWAAIAIREANFQRITKRVAWTRELIPQGNVRYEYPANLVNVGSKKAGFKLEEFGKEASTRGLV